MALQTKTKPRRRTTRAVAAEPGSRSRGRRPGLFREVGRNLRRRKLRSFLTLSGIALGAFALTVMGSLSENFNKQIGSLEEFLSEQVLVRPKGSSAFFSAGHVPVTLAGELERVEGVDVVVPNLEVTYEEGAGENFGPPQAINGVDIARARRSPLNDLELASGRRLEPGDRWKIVLGSTLARVAGEGERLGRNARPGDRVTIRNHEWEVVGVGVATATPVDGFAVASIDDTRTILKEADPFVDTARIAGELQVYPEDGVEPNDLADRIETVVGDRALVFPPETSLDQIQQQTAIFNAIILGSALVALLVGGVAIINTMVFSVTERTREIGIKKAIGASNRDILREFLAESAILSFSGGILGGVAGYLFTFGLNSTTRDTGVIAFTVTPRLALFVFALSLVIGAGAGLLPARRAARIDPVRALRTLG
jgi:putative ABC transport system permease protein